MPAAQDKRIRIGVDMGGTKIEFVALEHDGKELHRHRIATPRFDYEGTVRAVAESVQRIEKDLGRTATVGVGIPGTVYTKTSLVFFSSRRRHTRSPARRVRSRPDSR